VYTTNLLSNAMNSDVWALLSTDNEECWKAHACITALIVWQHHTLAVFPTSQRLFRFSTGHFPLLHHDRNRNRRPVGVVLIELRFFAVHVRSETQTLLAHFSPFTSY
jgi:hypothetical protein